MDTTARGLLNPSLPPLPNPTLTPRRTPGCCMVMATATRTTDTATLTTDTPTLDITTASGQPTPSPSLRLLPTLTQTKGRPLPALWWILRPPGLLRIPLRSQLCLRQEVRRA